MFSIQCLGVGRGASNFLTGAPSTGYVLKRGGAPLLLLDCGAGIGLSARRHLGGALPDAAYISHNHSDHTGDLPLFLATRAPRRATLLCHPAIAEILRVHRLHELPSVGIDPARDIDWQLSDASDTITWEGLQFTLLRTRHAYACYGALLSHEGRPILGWSADSRFDGALYDRLAAAPQVILHGRDAPGGDHATLEDIDAYARAHPDRAFHIAHYGQSAYRFGAQNAVLLSEGDEISL
ncbi:MBL fold metallo-hydrolase [Poseidonocella sedimentorum]|uniref:Ribonuclease BN, tRNA processing enzyme n=1 Tax=Poseidonocella sedimentorum TaxID=871652 RepID=A0A1I6CVL6_9RHOB|nr:MBL fold metallo-hydrolase [Poseidonocella sedimentorum]SFQ97131.1 Ribonuclease BN, tRNA processing enzyme [Poseidonocella sedimentorum]